MKVFLYCFTMFLLLIIPAEAQKFKVLESNSELIKIEFEFDNSYKIIVEGLPTYSAVTQSNIHFLPGEKDIYLTFTLESAEKPEEENGIVSGIVTDFFCETTVFIMSPPNFYCPG